MAITEVSPPRDYWDEFANAVSSAAKDITMAKDKRKAEEFRDRSIAIELVMKAMDRGMAGEDIVKAVGAAIPNASAGLMSSIKDLSSSAWAIQNAKNMEAARKQHEKFVTQQIQSMKDTSLNQKQSLEIQQTQAYAAIGNLLLNAKKTTLSEKQQKFIQRYMAFTAVSNLQLGLTKLRIEQLGLLAKSRVPGADGTRNNALGTTVDTILQQYAAGQKAFEKYAGDAFTSEGKKDFQNARKRLLAAQLNDVGVKSGFNVGAGWWETVLTKVDQATSGVMVTAAGVSRAAFNAMQQLADTPAANQLLGALAPVMRTIAQSKGAEAIDKGFDIIQKGEVVNLEVDRQKRQKQEPGVSVDYPLTAYRADVKPAMDNEFISSLQHSLSSMNETLNTLESAGMSFFSDSGLSSEDSLQGLWDNIPPELKGMFGQIPGTGQQGASKPGTTPAPSNGLGMFTPPKTK